MSVRANERSARARAAENVAETSYSFRCCSLGFAFMRNALLCKCFVQEQLVYPLHNDNYQKWH